MDGWMRTCLNLVVIKYPVRAPHSLLIRVHVLPFPNLLNDTGTLVNVLSHELECPYNKGITYDEEKGNVIQ